MSFLLPARKEMKKHDDQTSSTGRGKPHSSTWENQGEPCWAKWQDGGIDWNTKTAQTETLLWSGLISPNSKRLKPQNSCSKQPKKKSEYAVKVEFPELEEVEHKKRCPHRRIKHLPRKDKASKFSELFKNSHVNDFCQVIFSRNFFSQSQFNQFL